MKDIKVTTINNDFTVSPNGDAFISQRKAAELCGVAQSTLNEFYRSNNSDVNQGISSENLNFSITHYANKGKPEAIQTLILFSKAGAKAYIYHEAGYVLEAKKPKTRAELALEVYHLEVDMERVIAEKIRVEKQCLIRLSKIGQHLAGSTISEIENNLTFNNAAKIISTNLGIKLGHNSLMKLCRDNGWLMTGKRSRSEQNMPSESKIQYFRIKLFHDPETNKVTITPVITPAGVVELAKKIPLWYTQIQW